MTLTLHACVGSEPLSPLAVVVVKEVVLILYKASHFTQLTHHTFVVVFPHVQPTLFTASFIQTDPDNVPADDELLPRRAGP